MRFRELLGSGAQSAADLLAAAERAEREAETAAARLAELTDQHTAALLDGTDRELDLLEAAITTTLRDRDRWETAAAELRRRQAETAARERQAELDTLHAAGLAAQRKGVEALHKRYPKLARAVAELADELAGLLARIEEVNRMLARAGDPRRVESWEMVARPRALGQFAPGFLDELELPAGDRLGSLWTTGPGLALRGKAA